MVRGRTVFSSIFSWCSAATQGSEWSCAPATEPMTSLCADSVRGLRLAGVALRRGGAWCSPQTANPSVQKTRGPCPLCHRQPHHHHHHSTSQHWGARHRHRHRHGRSSRLQASLFCGEQDAVPGTALHCRKRRKVASPCLPASHCQLLPTRLVRMQLSGWEKPALVIRARRNIARSYSRARSTNILHASQYNLPFPTGPRIATSNASCANDVKRDFFPSAKGA